MIRINFCLSLPVGENAEEARRKIARLHNYCSNRPFSAIGAVQEFEKEPVEFAAPVVPEEVIGFRFMIANEGAEFAIKLAKFPDRDRAPLVWYCDGFVWIPKELNIQLYIIKYKAFIEAMNEAERIGFNVRVDDEAGFWSTKDVERLVSAIMRDRKFLDPRDMVR